MHRGRRASQVVDLVDLEQDLLDDVVADELEVGPADEVGDVGSRAREEVVEADDVVSPFDEERAEVGADEAGAARDDDAIGLDAGLGLDESGASRLVTSSLEVVVVVFVEFLVKKKRCQGPRSRKKRKERKKARLLFLLDCQSKK